MDDLISRRQAIDALGEAPKYKPRIIKTYAEGRNDQWFDDVAKLTLLSSAQPDRISYTVICDKFPSPHVYFNTYDEAEHWARFNQPNYRPYYIVERSEHFEIVGEVR